MHEESMFWAVIDKKQGGNKNIWKKEVRLQSWRG